jgi:hypothetical protein
MFELFFSSKPKPKLSAIQQPPKNERKKSSGESKENWFSERKAFSDCITALGREMENRPNISREEFQKQVASFSSWSGVNQHQKDALFLATELFCEQKERAEDFFSKWNNEKPALILRELTGLELDEIKSFQMKKGLMTIDIETDSITANKIFHNNAELREPCSFSGFHRESQTKNAGVSYIVIPEENAKNEKNYKHEEQHARNAIFQSIFEKMISDEEKTTAWEAYDSVSGKGKEKLVEFRNCINLELSSALLRAKDEIFAFSHNTDPDVALRQLLHNDDYDYLRDAREKALSEGVLAEKRKDYFNTALEKYRKIVSQGFQSFERLKVEFPGASPISFLVDQSIVSWPSYTEKLIREKRKLG